tara:strand:- start:202 stop:525 length:324 start_codon:yes stop_codon:yes gene_type:complete
MNNNLDTQTWKKSLSEDPNAICLDVRTSNEYNEAHIPNSLNMDIYDPTGFMKKINDLDHTKSYFIYCKSGKRSQMACEIMQQCGFYKLFNLDGGIEDWIEKGNETIK